MDLGRIYESWAWELRWISLLLSTSSFLGEAAKEYPFPTVQAFEVLGKGGVEDELRVIFAFKRNLKGTWFLKPRTNSVGLCQIQLWKEM
jgi:hypothetical protein